MGFVRRRYTKRPGAQYNSYWYSQSKCTLLRHFMKVSSDIALNIISANSKESLFNMFMT